MSADDVTVCIPSDAFWARVRVVDDADSCWLWQAGRFSNGYGQVWDGTRSRGAHRVAWELTHGQMPPPGAYICHQCDVPLCVRPSHLFLGDVRSNTADMCAKGRHANSTKTHCPAGHPYDEANTRLNVRGARECRTCARAAKLRHKRKRAAT